MWKNNNREKTGCHKIDTLISHRTRVEGDLYFTGGLHIDGQVRGNVVAEEPDNAVLTVGEKGQVEGEVNVADVMIGGTVIGDVIASNRVELSPNAVISGNVYYNLIKMAIGARVNGNLIHRPDERACLSAGVCEPALLQEPVTIEAETE